ncbi:hypothetical protein [Bernardetia sp.]|uniref:hypothetical protein n=1 Tax=Bernardetia sp. TaxID=1937974 RepID=UPI0025BE1F02|nr:hypothetical protein [Bernardetia sp.]
MLSPIILFVYKRASHTKNVLQALSECVNANRTHLIIYSDGAKTNATSEDIQAIEETRKILKEFNREKHSHFSSIEIYEAKQNKGLAKSVREGIDEQIEKYGKVIVLEDDIVPQKGFIKYMNDALEKYEAIQNVWGVSASAFPLANENKVREQTFFLPVNSSWGWATWTDRWQKIDFDINSIFQKFEECLITEKKFNFGNYYYYQILEAQKKQKIDSWAALFMANMFLNKGWFLFPKKSLVQNTGFDASGTHCTEEDLFFNTATTNFVEVEDISLDIENEGRKQTEKAFQKQFGKPSILKRIQNKFNPNSPYFILK